MPSIEEIRKNAPSGAKFYHIDICGGINYIGTVNGRSCIYIEYSNGTHEWQPMCYEVINDVKNNLQPL